MTILELLTVSSTNDYLKSYCSELLDLTLVYTTNQTEGKGRLGRKWQENGKSLAMSLLIKCKELSPALPLFIGLVVKEALTELLDDTLVNLKWPNDIIYSGKKVGGILCESVVRGGERCYICGIGINLSATKEEFCEAGLPHATSILAESQVLYPALEVVTVFCKQFKKLFTLFEKSGFAPFLDDYENVCVTVGREVTIYNGNAITYAFAKGVSQDGRLIAEDDNGVFYVDAGDVSVRGIDNYT